MAGKRRGADADRRPAAQVLVGARVGLGTLNEDELHVFVPGSAVVLHRHLDAIVGVAFELATAQVPVELFQVDAAGLPADEPPAHLGRRISAPVGVGLLDTPEVRCLAQARGAVHQDAVGALASLVGSLQHRAGGGVAAQGVDVDITVMFTLRAIGRRELDRDVLADVVAEVETYGCPIAVHDLAPGYYFEEFAAAVGGDLSLSDTPIRGARKGASCRRDKRGIRRKGSGTRCGRDLQALWYRRTENSCCPP